MYRNVLVPVAFDLEHKPEAALAVARTLTAPGGATSVLHVMEAPPPYAVSYIPEDYLDGLKRAIRAELQAMADGFENGIPVLIEGPAGRAILDWAEANDVDCIVIASRRPGVQDRLLGSTAAWVVQRAGCAVHVVR